jgi:hypothetical protein
MKEYTVLLRGAAIGTLQGEFVDNFCGGDLVPLPAFEAVRDTIADASRALANHGFLPPAGAFAGGISNEGSGAGSASLRAAQELCEQLELRDAYGRLMHTDWINIFGGRTTDDPILVMATLWHEESGTPASMPSPGVEDSGHDPEAG